MRFENGESEFVKLGGNVKRSFLYLVLWLTLFTAVIGAAVIMIATGQPKPLRPDAVGLSVIEKDMGVGR